MKVVFEFISKMFEKKSNIYSSLGSALICLSFLLPAENAQAQWRDVGSVATFASGYDSQCAYRLSISTQKGLAQDFIELTHTYKYSGPDESGKLVNSATLNAFVPGYMAAFLSDQGLMPTTFGYENEVDSKFAINLRLHVEKGDASKNFVLLDPVWTGIDHDYLWLNNSKVKIQRLCK